IAFEESECTLSDGDIIVMVSDGATADGDEWIKSEIRNFDGSAESLADEILNSAVKRFGAHEDDVTVLVSKLKRT
ncbi:MAG: SpoIIE family protein phosphatase, partial [Acutalibacteraceae bacterium]